MLTKINREWEILFFFILVFIFIRTIHYPQYLNFSHDQGLFSTRALEIYNGGVLTLIGPPISFNINGREIFQGSIIYYFQLMFLSLGRFDPIISSYLFMFFASLMVVPLFIGVKMLSNNLSAWMMVILYSLLPFYIDYSRFFWNPNFQFVLSPLLILLLGLFYRYHRNTYIFLIGVAAGILTEFHYQFFIIFLGLTTYLLYFLKIKKLTIAEFFSGTLLGLLPLIIFDLRNDFYNIRTVILFVNNKQQIIGGEGIVSPHYLLTISFFVLLIFFCRIRKILTKTIVFFSFILLLVISFVIYSPAPLHAFRMSENWSYLDEEKVHQIIMNENLTDFNIANLVYDTPGAVQKYLLQKDNIKGKFDNYSNNTYLFVITGEENFMDNPAYEVNTFEPSKIVKKWTINNMYILYLLQRIK